MAAIVTTQVLEKTPRGDGTNYVLFQFTLDTGDVVKDGPRFLPASTDLVAYAATIGASILETLAAQEVQQWLSA